MASTPADRIPAPIAPQYPQIHSRITGLAQDPWAWLSDKNHPETIPYLEAENTFANNWFLQHRDLIEKLFNEIKSRTLEDDTTVAMRHGPWWYLRQTISGSGYQVHRRGATKEHASEFVILDENIESRTIENFRLGAFEISGDHNLLAWSYEVDGSELFTVRIRDLTTGHDSEDKIVDTSNAGLAWSSDNQHLFYVTHDAAMRPNKIWRHKLGNDQKADEVVFEEHDERFNLSIEATRSGRWIVIKSQSRLTSECFLVATNDALKAPIMVRPRQDEVEYDIDHWGECFVILTNLDAVDYRVMSASLHEPGAWTELVAHTVGRRIYGMEPFRDHLVIQEWCEAQQRIRVVARNGSISELHTGDDPHELSFEQCPEWDTEYVRYASESLVSPSAIFDHNLITNQRTMLKTQAIPNTDLSKYLATREWATAPDGTRIPLDIVRHKDTPINGTAPGMLYAYGAYESAVPPWFSAARLSLLDRGWIWALAHPRGGGECGRHWYLDGRLMNKRNTFTDVNACAKHLYRHHVAAGKLALRGMSAGGLMVGACITSEPDLFGAALAEVPFVDVINSMSDPSLPLTINEWEEWGDPRGEPAASYMLAYSPYDNAKADAYPPMLVTGGLNDPRVRYHEPAKWVAKLRSLGACRQPLIFECEMTAGHFGKSNRYEQWKYEAKLMAFALVVCRKADAKNKGPRD